MSCHIITEAQACDSWRVWQEEFFKSPEQVSAAQPSGRPNTQPVATLCFTFSQVPHDLEMTQGPRMKKILRIPITSSITSSGPTYKAERLRMNEESGSWAQQTSLWMWMNGCNILSNLGQGSSVFLPLACWSQMTLGRWTALLFLAGSQIVYNPQTKPKKKKSKIVNSRFWGEDGAANKHCW